MKSSPFNIIWILFVIVLGARSEIDFTQYRISLMPPNKEYIKYVEERHVVMCEGDVKEDDDNLKWLKPDGMEVASRGRVKQEIVKGKLWLIFDSIAKEDQGEWTCVSNFDEGGDGKSFMMNVYVPISFEISQPTIEVKEGDDISIPCEVYGLPEPTIQWYYDEENLAESLLNESGKYKRLADGLLVRNVRHDDSGDYKCKAFQITEIMTNVEEQTIQLNVQYKPVMSGKAHKEVFGFVDGEVDLLCDAHAWPKPQFLWFRHGKRISQKNIKENDNHSILRIHLKSKDDLGDYKCKARNDLGESEQRITIIEGKKPEMPKVFFIRGFSSDTFDLDVGAKVDPKTQTKMSIIGYRFELIPKTVFEKQKSWNGSWVKEFAVADGVTYLLSPLSENTTYKVRVASKNHAGYSDYTETLEFTTLSKQPLISGGSNMQAPMILAKVFFMCLIIKNVVKL